MGNPIRLQTGWSQIKRPHLTLGSVERCALTSFLFRNSVLSMNLMLKQISAVLVLFALSLMYNEFMLVLKTETKYLKEIRFRISICMSW